MTVLTTYRTAASTVVTDMSFVPSSFDGLFRHYYFFVTQLVKRRGIAEQNAEDVAMAVLEKFWEKDVLHDFDPTIIARSGRPSLFGSFLGAFVLSHLPSHWHKQRRLLQFEFDLIDSDIEPYLASEPSPWMDYRGYYSEDDTTDVEEQELVSIVRAHLILSKPVNAQDKCDLVALFDSIRARTASGQKMSLVALVEEFGVSKTTIQKWLKRLRAEVDLILETD